MSSDREQGIMLATIVNTCVTHGPYLYVHILHLVTKVMLRARMSTISSNCVRMALKDYMELD